MTAFIASIDVGTTNIKVNLFDETYQLHSTLSYPHLDIVSTDDVFELSFEEIWRNIVAAVSELLEKVKMSELEIVLTTAMHSVQLMTVDFELSGGLVTWADKRGSQVIHAETDALKRAQYLRTGTPIHTMNPYYKLRELYVRGLKVASVKDLLFQRLTGEWVLDKSNAAASGLLNVDSLTWDEASLEATDLTADLLPRLVEVDYNCEALDIFAGATEAGVKVSVTIGTSDGISSNYVFDDLKNVAVLSIGTSHAVRVVHTSAQLNPDYQNFAYYIKPERYLVGLPSNNGADVLAWLNRIFNSSFKELDQVAELRPDTREVFLPYLNGERAPLWDESAVGHLFKLTRTSSRESILYSVILGMMFNIKHNVSLLAELVDFEALGVVGGVMSLEAMPQLLADVLGYTLYVPKLPNAETLGSIAVSKNITFQGDYRVVTPDPAADFSDLYAGYLEMIKKVSV
ncbi:FGGY family carbohydrate kinase [Fundicoccus sp. Sow4_D5]|uniref:FGGY family carbohydrate kinase n=1 Tax=Fundicoccus sp. Sow4_D5 TaxID=3438782 RepID=UPI003F8F0D1A